MLKINHNRKYLIILPLALAMFFAGAEDSSAETAAVDPGTTTKETVCELATALDNLLEVKDSGLTGIERDRTEFKARKEVLNQTVVCSLEEISSAKIRLNELTVATGTDEVLLGQFTEELGLAELTVGIFAKDVATSTGLLEVKDLAAKILEWRSKNYLPLLDKINNFILVVSSERSSETAVARLQKISTTLGILRLNQVPEIKTLLDASTKLTKKSLALNLEARSIISGYLITPKSARTATSSAKATTTEKELEIKVPEAATSTSEETNKASSTAPIHLVKESLVSLKGAYGNYIKISALVREILGL